MKQLTDFSFLTQAIALAKTRKKVALACPYDEHTQEVVARALESNMAQFIFTTSRPIDEHFAILLEKHADKVVVIECPDDKSAAAKAVELVKNNKADILMKGLLNTDVLLKAALDKQDGILQKGSVMTHISVAQIPGHDKLLMFSDAAVIPQPSFDQFDAIVGYCADACRKLGVVRPHIALIHFTEKVNAKYPNTIYYQEIVEKSERGAYGDVVIGGPMDVKTACDIDSGNVKGIDTPVAGNADVLVFPNIESANTFYKTITHFAKAVVAGWLAGTQVPVVLSSRADSVDSKFYSLALACAL